MRYRALLSPQGEQTAFLEAIVLRALHIPRIRPTLGHVRLMLLAADIALWIAIICAVRHVWG